MESNWAAENLQIIRTLMERSAVYRRALAPTTLLVGGVGIAASIVGWLARIESGRAFGVYWLGVCIVAVIGAFLVVRRQALRESEPFWSPPTRRVAQALMPGFFAGLICGILILAPIGDPRQAWWLPPVWMVLYGLTLHSAGFFMPRGIRLFGWIFVVCGCAVLVVVRGQFEADALGPLTQAHGVMGGAFGALHAAYGIYLSLTEKRTNET